MADTSEPNQGPAGDDAVRPLSEKINWLIDNMWPPELPKPKSNAEIARAIEERVPDARISRHQVSNLRRGQDVNPTLKTLTMLATFFDVPLGYFGTDSAAKKLEVQLTRLAVLGDSDVDHVALRGMSNLSHEGRQMVIDMIDRVVQMERQRGE